VLLFGEGTPGPMFLSVKSALVLVLLFGEGAHVLFLRCGRNNAPSPMCTSVLLAKNASVLHFSNGAPVLLFVEGTPVLVLLFGEVALVLLFGQGTPVSMLSLVKAHRCSSLVKAH